MNTQLNREPNSEQLTRSCYAVMLALHCMLLLLLHEINTQRYDDKQHRTGFREKARAG